MVKRLLEGIHPASLWNRKRQIPRVSKPIMRRSGVKEYIFTGIANVKFLSSPNYEKKWGKKMYFYWYRKCSSHLQIVRRRGLKLQSIFSPEQDVLKGTAPSLVSLRKGNLMIGIIDLVIASYPR